MDKPPVGTHGSCVRQIGNANPMPNRISPRADFHNYSGGDYFVTICTEHKEHFFGKIHENAMYLSPIGEYCKQQLESITEHYPYAQNLLFVVMPNHIHAIIRIIDNSLSKNLENRTHEPCVPTIRTALSVVIGGLKRSVTLYARRNNINFGWQQRYHDHIIRNNRDGWYISDYISNNINRWSSDCFYK